MNITRLDEQQIATVVADIANKEGSDGQDSPGNRNMLNMSMWDRRDRRCVQLDAGRGPTTLSAYRSLTAVFPDEGAPLRRGTAKVLTTPAPQLLIT
jgi:hypothetical protein